MFLADNCAVCGNPKYNTRDLKQKNVTLYPQNEYDRFSHKEVWNTNTMKIFHQKEDNRSLTTKYQTLKDSKRRNAANQFKDNETIFGHREAS